MRWYELAENPNVIAELYSEVPSLQTIDLMKVELITEDAKMVLHATLSRFSDKPLTLWIERGYNVIHIKLEFWDLRSLRISQWSTENLVDAQIDQTPEGHISLNIMSPQCDIRATARSLRIGSVSAYLQGVF